LGLYLYPDLKKGTNKWNELDSSASKFHNHYTKDNVNVECHMNIGTSLPKLTVTNMIVNSFMVTKGFP